MSGELLGPIPTDFPKGVRVGWGSEGEGVNFRTSGAEEERMSSITGDFLCGTDPMGMLGEAP